MALRDFQGSIGTPPRILGNPEFGRTADITLPLCLRRSMGSFARPGAYAHGSDELENPTWLFLPAERQGVGGPVELNAREPDVEVNRPIAMSGVLSSCEAIR